MKDILTEEFLRMKRMRRRDFSIFVEVGVIKVDR
jgi:hypothetical protein